MPYHSSRSSASRSIEDRVRDALRNSSAKTQGRTGPPEGTRPQSTQSAGSSPKSKSDASEASAGAQPSSSATSATRASSQGSSTQAKSPLGSHGVPGSTAADAQSSTLSTAARATQLAEALAEISTHVKNSNTSLFSRITRERRQGQKPSSIGYYDIDKVIGEGNFAKVKLATHSLTGEKVAIKVIDKTRLDIPTIRKLTREVRIMKTLSHPHVIRMYECIETGGELNIVLEYAPGGEIFDFLVKHGRLAEPDARRYFRQIVAAVDYCHKTHIIHRDLKAENLLLDTNMNIKIADFGFANDFLPGHYLNTWCGSPPYAAPELFQGFQYFGPEVDIWSLGVVLYVLVCGSLPFDGNAVTKLRAKVLAGLGKIPYKCSIDLEALIRKMLTVEPKKRASMEEIKKDKWLNTGYEKDPPINSEMEGGPPMLVLSLQEEIAVYKECAEIGIDITKLQASLKKESYDCVTASYYILKNRIISKKLAERHPQQPLLPSPDAAKQNGDGGGTEGADANQQALGEKSGLPKDKKVPTSPKTEERESAGCKADTTGLQGDKEPGGRPAAGRSDGKSGAAGPVQAGPGIPVDTQARARGEGSNTAGETDSTSGGGHPRKGTGAVMNLVLSGSSVTGDSQDIGSEVVSISELVASRGASSKSKNEAVVEDGGGQSTGGNCKDAAVAAVASATEESDMAPGGPLQQPPAENGNIASSGTGCSPSSPSAPSSPSSSGVPSSARGTRRRSSVSSRSGQQLEPRELRFTFSVTNTSGKPADVILKEIIRVLQQNTVAFSAAGYLLTCKSEEVEFEIEVCRLAKLATNGVRIKRLAGSALTYKSLYDTMVGQFVF